VFVVLGADLATWEKELGVQRGVGVGKELIDFEVGLDDAVGIVGGGGRMRNAAIFRVNRFQQLVQRGKFNAKQKGDAMEEPIGKGKVHVVFEEKQGNHGFKRTGAELQAAQAAVFVKQKGCGGLGALDAVGPVVGRRIDEQGLVVEKKLDALEKQKGCKGFVEKAFGSGGELDIEVDFVQGCRGMRRMEHVLNLAAELGIALVGDS
jgi:hypothetical protein